jgi:capsular exopolysaccharide synthesis family protein
MSRFFKTLKEASRTAPDPVAGSWLEDPVSENEPAQPEAALPEHVSEAAELPAAAAEPDWAFGMEPPREGPIPFPKTPAEETSPEFPPIPATGWPLDFQAPPQPATGNRSSPVARKPALDLESLISPPASPWKGSPASHVPISLDTTARLLPHVTNSGVVEHYRRLRTKLLQQHATRPFQILLVTSPGPEEGKTVTVLNLALSYAMLPNYKVLIVDGDLRKGSLGKWLGVHGTPGLSNLIDGSATLEQVVLKSDEFPVHFMVRGNSKTPAAELLNSPLLGTHLRHMVEHFDLVIVDSPPVNVITDTHLLAANCDGVLLVARAYSTTCKALERAAADLSAFRIVGTVLNGANRNQLYRRYDGYY